MIMLLNVLWIVLYYLTTISEAQLITEDNSCQTPDHVVGFCVLIKQCKPILTLLTEIPKPLSANNTRLLRSYQCGFKGQEVKVCCPSEPITLGSRSTTDAIPDPPDVSNHKNINLLPKDCGYLSTVDKIVFGEKTGLYEFPWMALLSYRGPGGPTFKCGGTIINDKYILTAAHCISELKTPLIGIRVGEHNIDQRTECETISNKRVCAPPVQDWTVEEMIPHPEFSSELLNNDIGLIRIAGRMNLSIESVRPVCLPQENLGRFNYTGRTAIVTGWGITETGRKSSELLKAEIPVIPLADCRREYEKRTEVTYKHLCAGGRNKTDSCRGDSGGPLQIAAELFGEARYVQQGITSFGPKACGAEGIPGVYTQVAYYLDWILDTIR